MSKHRFILSVRNEVRDYEAGVRCSRCGEVVLFVNGDIPEAKDKEECPCGDEGQGTEPPRDAAS